MEDFACDPIATQRGKTSTSPWPTLDEQAQASPPSHQDRIDHLSTTSQDEPARWILTTPPGKTRRTATLNGTKRSTPPFAVTIVDLDDDEDDDDDNDDDGSDIDDGNVDNIDGLQGLNHISHSNNTSTILKPTKPPGIETLHASRPLQKNLQMFDPLNSENSSKHDKEAILEPQQQQPRRRHASIGGITAGNNRVAYQKAAAAPTRLSTSKSSCVMSSLPSRSRPSQQHQQKHQHQQQQQGTINNWLDLDSHESTVIPIVPSKQACQQPASMISSFVEKSSKGGGPRDPADFKGKANRQLVDFDPFLSQDPLDRKDAFKYMERDETAMSGPTAAPRPMIDTRIPLPTSKKSNSNSTLSSEEDEEEPTPTHYQQVPSSTTAPLACNSKQHETYYGDRIFRRPSLLTNDLIQEQRDKERHLSRCLDVDLVSVQGELCVPETISSLPDAEQPMPHDTHHSSISSSVSSTTSPISQPPLQRQVSSLHERLQELVNDEAAWNEVTHSDGSYADNDAWSAEDYPQPPPPVLAPTTTTTTGPPKRRTRPSFHTKRTIPVATATPACLPSPTLSPPPHRPAMSPSAAHKLYYLHLSPFEQQEITNYAQIFFVGHHAKNKHQATMDRPDNNFGYDDDRGDYLLVPKDHLAYRYEILETMGKGSFGQVVKALDHKTGTMVAVKLIRNKKRFHAQALVEVKTLEDLMKWDPEDKHNNVRMTDHFYFRHHLCIAFECLSINLYDFIKNNHFQGSSMGLIRRFTIQLLNSLTILYQHHLIHCDLKPENILLKHPTKSTIKVIDFGSSCLENEKVYTYIQSRFYRAPEVILGLDYSTAIDMWSVGCILAELYTGYPLFPGENEQDQLACIMEVCGVPSRGLVEKSPRRKGFFDLYGNPKIMPDSKGKKRKPGTRSLPSILKCSDDKFVDFILQCLQWDPDERIKPDEAFKHGWIARLPQ